MKVWHAVVIGVLLVEFVRPTWLRRSLVVGLLFFCITGCR
jgi:hypothetical protein